MVEFLFDFIISIVVIVFLMILIINVKDDFKHSKIENEEASNNSNNDIFIWNKSSSENEKSNIIYSSMYKYLSLISIFTSLSICLVILNSYNDLIIYLLSYVENAKVKLPIVGSVIISFFISGFLYMKTLFTQYKKTKMSKLEMQFRARAIMSTFLSLALFVLILNFIPKISKEYNIIKTISLSFVAGMGFHIVFPELPKFHKI